MTNGKVNMNLKEALKHGVVTLRDKGLEQPLTDALAILCFVLHCDKTYIYTHGEKPVSQDDFNKFMNFIEMRSLGKPVQYITGRQEFMSLEFFVNENVLIPRPETEILVETVLYEAKSLGAVDLRILDMGTGSGCIGISLAYYLPHSHVTCVDISQKALDVARKNAERLGVADRMHFIQSNIFENVLNMKFHVIVSNPPYIPSGEIVKLEANVRDFEPRTALDGGEDGLSFYRTIIAEAPDYLTEGGLLAMEVGIGQAEDVSNIMSSAFTGIRIVEDLQGIGRVVYARKA